MIDISIIPTGSGVVSLGFVTYGVLRGFEPDRVGRLVLLGTLAGGLAAAAALAVALVNDVLSEAVFRALAPHLMIMVLIAMGGGLAYSLGGPAWLVHVALLVGAFAALPGYLRWDEREHPRR